MSRPLASAILTILCAATALTIVAHTHANPRTHVAALVGDDKSAQKDEAPRARLERKVRKLLDLNGTAAIQKQSMDKMVDQFKKMKVPTEFMESFRDKLDYDHMMTLSVKAYADNMEETTVDSVIAYFQTEDGQKYATALPDTMDQAMQAGMEYGQEVAQQVVEELKKSKK